jgi:hypothetical protein
MKKLFLILSFALFVAPVFAGDELESWSVRGSAYYAEFGVGNATPSWTANLAIPDDCDVASVQIVGGTEYQWSTYGTATFSGSISNATIEVVFTAYTIAAATDHTAAPAPTFRLGYDTDGTDTSQTWEFDEIPYISEYGHYILPTGAANSLRLRMQRSGSTSAVGAIVRFKKGQP